MQICGYLKGSWYIIYYHGSSFLGGGARIKMKYDLLLVSVTRWSVETYAKLRPAKPKTRACLENHEICYFLYLFFSKASVYSKDRLCSLLIFYVNDVLI